DDRAGALGFGLNQKPPAPLRKFNKTLELERLQKIAEKLIREQLEEPDHETIQAQELLLLGTSMGGARPKAVVEDDVGLWVAKFGRQDDRWNNPRVEHAMLELARSCGINAARSRIESVGGKDVLLVQRFDRERTTRGYVRARMISGLTLLRAEELPLQRDRWSYVLMSEELRRVVAEPRRDAAELFRRICFNALISNTDDHPRNHALIAFDRDWRLSPAYDLTPSPAISLERRDLALECGNFGRFANANNLLTQCSRFLLDQNEAKEIISTMTEQVRANWYSVVRAQGVSERDTETIKGAFVYEGF
ncbi:MAG: HipA domain-containing protein, partial [Candidatus Melainabacteria bacterium]|nr:HipA domain-containing protein [Candidatus Melainabacteria bacterium]